VTTTNQTNNNKPTEQALARQTIAGVDKHFATTNVTLAGETFTPTALKGVFQDEINALDAVDASRTAWRQKVAEGKAAKKRARAVRKAFKRFILGTFGDAAVTVIEDCGFTVPKSTATRKAAVKAEAVVKAKATREVRHTMGKKQKSAIKGQPVQPATPPAAAPTPAPTK
jgi:hypothetical protein